MVTEHKRTIVEVCLILVCVCVCVFELSVNCMVSAKAFFKGNKSPAEGVSAPITLREKAKQQLTSSPSLYPLCNSPFCFPRLIVFACFLFFFFPFFHNSPRPCLEFKTGGSGESMAGVFCTSISLVPIPLKAD